ncbi:MAG: hypothetical protein IC227_09040 [Enterococcus lacertideformus]|uniref:Uncharacterized protein n=1 Tax=Enterococcus lacertideformus TaxID=2771493 RepID=A0A931AV66_9ENTE|nr:hypothetical protein [Enterococcus lacertideformus]
MKKKVNLIAHALFVFMTVSGTCTPLIANAEQLVSSEETRVGSLVGTSENLNDTQSASAFEASNATTPTVQDTMEQNDVVK